MLNLQHFVTNNVYNARGKIERFLKMKRLLDQKCAANLRLLATKNNINRASDYHYLNLAVTQSTEPINGMDYIHPVVKPNVDYVTAVIAKGLASNGDLNFEFPAVNEQDEVAARQATEMVNNIVNQQNDFQKILQHWIMDSLLHKNGEMLISPIREQITRYVKTQGTESQLQAFEAQAADAGLTVVRNSKRKSRVDLEQVKAETQQFQQFANEADRDAAIETMLSNLDATGQGLESVAEMPSLTEVEEGETMLMDSLARNTIYEAEYKLTGYNINIRFKPISQHYWMCDPTVINIQDQPFCGFYDPMTVQEATEYYPGINLEEFERHAEYSNVGAYQAGSLLNNLAIHARDSVPINGLPSTGYAAQESEARQVTVLTVWNRYDIDGDGELELIELIYSGNYVISAREVEFIPVANMCPRPLPQNFYGMSLAESLVPAQEYATAASRAELQLGLLTATPRIGVNPDKVDFEMLQDGEAAIFILDSRFNPATDIYPIPTPSGNPAFLENALQRLQSDTMSLVGMTTPQDVFNPEVMSQGNSGAKLQIALTPNQIIQDNTIKNAAQGVREAIWLVWRTLIQYSDDYGVKKLAQLYHPDSLAEFIDAKNYEDLNFIDRKLIHIELALGMRSEENALQRQQIIVQAQTQLYQAAQTMVAQGTLTPTIWKKIKKPYEDTLYLLGVKDCDVYLPTDEEIMAMIQQAQQAMSNQPPSKDQTAAQLDLAKIKEIEARITGQTPEGLERLSKAEATKANMMGTSAERMLEAFALQTKGKATNY